MRTCSRSPTAVVAPDVSGAIVARRMHDLLLAERRDQLTGWRRRVGDLLLLAPPSRPALLQTVVDDDQPRERIGPPPTGEGVQHQPHEDGGGEASVDEGHMRFGHQHGVA